MKTDHLCALGVHARWHWFASILVLWPTMYAMAVPLPQESAEKPAAQVTAPASSVLGGSPQNESVSLAAGHAMAADEIIAILQAQPELMTAAKVQIGQQISVDPTTITDEDVYRRIRQDTALRIRISQELRARGYAPSDAGDDVVPASPSKTSAAGARRHAGRPEVPADDRNEPQVLKRTNPYHTLPSLDDLYSQIPPDEEKLKRFGSETFRLGTGNADELPMDVPVGPDYVLGPGDSLVLNLWGSIAQHLNRIVDRQGQIALPEAGPITIVGLTLAQAQEAIQKSLSTQFRNIRVEISLGRLRTVRVYVVGDVQRPGAYDISSLSTPLNALYAAGGPTSRGSLRTLRQFRGNQLLREIDLYDFLLHGIRSDVGRLLPGDTLLVPPVGPQVTVSGMVRRPAIYELKDETSLKEVLDLAGGVLVSATLRQINVERIEAHERRTMLSVRLGEASSDPFAHAQGVIGGSGDRATAAGDGGATAPQLADLKSPDHRATGSPDRADSAVGSTITRLPDHPITGLPAAATSQLAEFRLVEFRMEDGDHVRVSPILPYNERAVYLQGHVFRPGKFAYRDGMTINDLLRSYQDVMPEPANHAELIRLQPPDFRPATISLNLSDVLQGDDAIYLQPFDVIRVFGRYEIDPPAVTIYGEVLRPGEYPLAQEMTAAGLVRMAGGFKRSAFREQADLASYVLQNGQKILAKQSVVAIGKALDGETAADVRLKPGDVLSIRQLAGWKDIGAAVTVSGEVLYAGKYGIAEGERLSSILKRAGGFREEAYPPGAILERVQVREIGEKTRLEMIRRIETTPVTLKPGLATTQDTTATLQAMQQQQQQILAALRSHHATGRQVIKISRTVSQWENTPADVEMRAGDVLIIPKRPNFVNISGQVYNPAAITYAPGRTAEWYLRQGGGPTEMANKRAIFVVRADGSVVGKTGGALSTRLQPGDSIVVPEKILAGSRLWQNLLGAGQIMSSAGIIAAVAVLK